MLKPKYLRRKFTGECDVFLQDPLPANFNGNIPGHTCLQPARHYTAADIGMFGAYLCDVHAEKREELTDD